MRGHDESCRGCRHLSLLEHKICNAGFRKLLGMGKGRFRTLMGAVRAGQQFAPLDGRFIPREAPKQSAKREAVYDFLFELWEQAGETLPDQSHSSSNKRPRQGKYRIDDPQGDRSLIRHIPPGKIADYWRLCKLQHPDITISKKLFSSVGGSVVDQPSCCILILFEVSTHPNIWGCLKIGVPIWVPETFFVLGKKKEFRAPLFWDIPIYSVSPAKPMRCGCRNSPSAFEFGHTATMQSAVFASGIAWSWNSCCKAQRELHKWRCTDCI